MTFKKRTIKIPAEQEKLLRQLFYFFISSVLFFSFFPLKSLKAEDLTVQNIAVDNVRPNDSQPSPGEASFFQLEEELVSVASKSLTALREAPGIVTILTRDQIVNAGAHDLMAALLLIPGVQFGTDVFGVVSIGVRGIWGQEGKVLLLWDGHEINDLLFSNLEFGRHFPVDDIERIEMIRGPGSVLYGGFAELSVINVVTRSAKTLNGGYVNGFLGQTAKANAALDVAAGYGKVLPNDLSIKISGYWGKGIRSEREYTDVFGSSYSLQENSINPALVSFDLGYKGFDLRFLLDRYHLEQRDETEAIIPLARRNHFDSYYLLTQYEWKPSPSLTIIPRFTFKHQRPWNNTPFIPEGEGAPYNRSVVRYSGAIGAQYTPTKRVSLLTGVEAYIDQAEDHTGIPFANGKDSISYWDVSAFGEVELKLPVTLYIGARYDKHEQYGTSIVPRFALIKSFKRLHFKLLASQAYRAPGIENINGNDLAIAEGFDVAPIKPEKTTIFELESGYKITDNLQLTVDFFDMRINRPIVYFVLSGNQPGYQNLGRLGTQGVELELRWTHRRGYLNLNYSYYSSIHTDGPSYQVPNHSNYFLGFAQHKIAAYASIRLIDELRINPTFIFLGPRYGYATVDAEGNGIIQRFDPVFLLDLNVIYQPKKIKGLEIQAGVNNLFGENAAFIQPYNNLHAPLPSLGREYLMKVMYQF